MNDFDKFMRKIKILSVLLGLALIMNVIGSCARSLKIQEMESRLEKLEEK